MPGDRIRSPLYADKGGRGGGRRLQSAGLERIGGLGDWHSTIMGVLEREREDEDRQAGEGWRGRGGGGGVGE